MIKPIPFLHMRGVTQDTINRYRIETTNFANRPALRYPTIGTTGTPSYRIKYTDGNKPKYIWDGGKGEGVTYYSAGGLGDALMNAPYIWILNGEPAVWALHSFGVACGLDVNHAAPALVWFGETSVPQSLLEDLEWWGAKEVRFVPDCDDKGLVTAHKVYEQLRPSRIKLAVMELPFEVDSKKDFNDLWIEAKFQRDPMMKLILDMPTLTIEQIEARIPQPAIVVNSVATMELPFRAAPATNGNGHHTTEIDHKELYQQWLDLVIWKLGSPVKMEGDTPRWHCPLPNHDDKNPSFTVDMEKMRPRCSCGIHADNDAWDKVAAALGTDTWKEYAAGYRESVKRLDALKVEWAQQGKPPPPPTPQSDDNRIQRVSHDGDTSMDNVLKIIRGDTKSIGNPVVFPLRCLYDAGGLCQIIPSGKMVGIVGGSGTGKTALGDTIIDYYSKIGIDCILSSDEWTPDEVMARRIQRYTGYNGVPHVTLNDWNNHILWLKEGELGVPVEQRAGVCLSEWQIKTVEETANKVKSWKGKVTHIYEEDANQPVLYFEDFLALVAETLTIRRKENRRADVVLIDYLSLLRLRDVPRGNEIEFIGSMLKNHCLRHKYVPFVLSQVTKNASKNAKVNGQALTSDDAQFMRSDKYNLMLAINTEIVDDKPTGFSYLSVEKNSLGKTRVRAKLRFDAAHLTYEDKNYEVELP